MGTVNCIPYIAEGAAPVANADVSGIGVVLAFVLSAYITFAAVFGAYVFGMVDERLLGQFDRRLFGIRSYDSAAASVRRKQVHAAIRAAVLNLSDQQIVTGIAIMGAGFNGLRDGSITVYHFQIILYLAWMSSSVHLTTITLLAYYLQVHPGILAWRLVGMIVLFVMLVIGLIPTISNDWGLLDWTIPPIPNRTGWSIPAQCFWLKYWTDGRSPDAPVGFIILGISYLWKIGQLSTRVKSACAANVSDPLQRWVIHAWRYTAKRHAAAGDNVTLKLAWKTLLLLQLCPSLLIFVLIEFSLSFAASLWLTALGLVFGTVEVMIPRGQMEPLLSYQEDSWSFGQLVPLILLVQPIGAVMEHLWTREGKDFQSVSSWSRFESSHVAQTPAPVTVDEPSALESQTTNTQGSVINTSLVTEVLFSSRFVKLLGWLMQVFLVILCAAISVEFVETIGFPSDGKWLLIVQPLALYIGVAFVLILIVGPFHRIFWDILRFKL